MTTKHHTPGKFKYELFQGDCLEVLPKLGQFDVVFADPFDNIGLRYDEYVDKMPDPSYIDFLRELIDKCSMKAPTLWLSFNAKWTFYMGMLFQEFLTEHDEWQAKACVQVFTFGQHNKNDLGNNHRPLWRLKRKDAPLYPNSIKVPSWRQRNGDKRAAPGGRVPGDVFDMQYPQDEFAFGMLMGDMVDQPWVSGITEEAWRELVNYLREHRSILPGEHWGILPGDVFDFPRVTGNSKQRCDWHETQLHEELIERCIKLSTPEGGRVLDPFGGTGTTLRVCRKINRSCTLIELSQGYCQKISELNGVSIT